MTFFYLHIGEHFLKPEDYYFWQDTKEHIPKHFQKILMGYGAEGSNTKLMCQLIDMRRREFEEIAEQIRESNEDLKPEFRTLTPEMERFAAKVQATAVVSAGHILRVRIREEDLLIKFLVSWLVLLYKQTRKFIDNL